MSLLVTQLILLYTNDDTNSKITATEITDHSHGN
jgi:hypothetical protein